MINSLIFFLLSVTAAPKEEYVVIPSEKGNVEQVYIMPESSCGVFKTCVTRPFVFAYSPRGREFFAIDGHAYEAWCDSREAWLGDICYTTSAQPRRFVVAIVNRHTKKADVLFSLESKVSRVFVRREFCNRIVNCSLTVADDAFLDIPSKMKRLNGMEIPSNRSEASRMLRTLLGDKFISTLGTTEMNEQNRNLGPRCISTSSTADELIKSELESHWRLNEDNSPLVRFYRDNISERADADYIVVDVMSTLCWGAIVCDDQTDGLQRWSSTSDGCPGTKN